MKPTLILLGLGMAAMTVFNFWAPDASFFREPSLARIIFWHLPSAFICSGILFINTYFGLRYLKTRSMEWDVRLAASTELGTMFAVVTMVTGIIFSRAQWGEWWQWDPRQASFLMVLFLLALAMALRGGFSDEKRRASASSAYAVLSLLPSVFLIFVFPRLKQVEALSLHPSQTIVKGLLDGPYRTGVWGTFIVLAFIAWYLYKQRVGAGILEIKLEQTNGLGEGMVDRSASTVMVRPVAVSEKNQ